MSDFKNIPTNIISGFLGAGKTTAIQYCLSHKPVSEKWAVIVNEFGQVGVDGALLKNDSVSIKEIPGGCLCCVGSQSLNVGLNQIIRSLRPDRILIEPTGLGHPAKLIASLSGEYYKNVLNLKAVINLLDARNLNDERYLHNVTFIEQSKLADILVATKSDTYTDDHVKAFSDYAGSFDPLKLATGMIEQGQLKLQWLDMARQNNQSADTGTDAHTHHNAQVAVCAEPSDWQMLQGNSDGFFSVGWKLHNAIKFERHKLIDFTENLFIDVNIERVKGVVRTESGWVLLNLTRSEKDIGDLATRDMEGRMHSVLEIISANSLDAQALNLALMMCQE